MRMNLMSDECRCYSAVQKEKVQSTTDYVKPPPRDVRPDTSVQLIRQANGRLRTPGIEQEWARVLPVKPGPGPTQRQDIGETVGSKKVPCQMG